MTRPELATPPVAASRTRRSIARAFGIQVDACFAIPHLPQAPGTWSGPRTTLEAIPAVELRRIWPSRSETLLERHLPDGRRGLVIERHESLGLHVWAPRYGRHLVGTDGARIRSALPAITAWRWERLLFAHVLPLAAELQGRRLLHASAVSLAGSAVAFAGPSGAGKSSIAAHLVARGATLVTDDVLALDVTDGAIAAHPGAGLTGIGAHELSAMSDEERARLGPRVATADKIYLQCRVAGDAQPLRALYFLVAGRDEVPTIRACSTVAPLLLGSAFISYLRDPAHLIGHLDASSRIASVVPTFEVSIRHGAGAKDSARAIEDHAGTVLR